MGESKMVLSAIESGSLLTFTIGNM